MIRVLAVGDAVMAAGEPGIFVDDAAQPVAEFVVRPLPQGAKGTAGGYDRVVIDPVAGGNLGDPVRHAGTAGNAVDQSPRPFEDAMQHPLGRRHLPQHIHMNAAFAVRPLMGDARLLDTAGDGVGDQLLVALAPGSAEIELWDRLSRLIVAVGVDAGEGADPARGGPGARTLAV